MARTPVGNSVEAAGAGRDLVAELEARAAAGDPEAQDDLFGGPLFAGPVGHVADRLTEAKGRGRPKGAANRRTEQMRETLLRMGFRHPMLNLAAIANADPVKLAAELSEPYRPDSGRRKGELVEESVTPGEALALIVKANAELLPYFESKRPVEVHVEERQLGVLLVGELPSEAVAEGVLSVTGVVIDSEENQ